ncbi:steroid 5 alpha-reductase [Akanthomyces lecanii RCEF 1005]|uniref:Steroid 5 alpha-reductase n=1 Tax=Akanthomyces lecanii RCEF 1005 TaxID=1081108 RepID=A0A168I1R2_CORDF|nr:steroid 5 alpha-reductase [Akanthomyces lecanii RCEF 1005]
MAIVQDWLPPTRENYETLVPPFRSMQWVIKWYGMGKTSVRSPLNIPGRIAWMTMEAPGFLTLVYIMNTLPQQHGIHDLPWPPFFLPALFMLTCAKVIHYLNRAILFPLMQPSMAPIHVAVWAMAVGFQLCNATCLGSWLSAYGVVTEAGWAAQSPLPQFAFGLALFYVGLAGNWFHDEELREIRRKEQRRQDRLRAESGAGGAPAVEKHYEIPQAGLFKYMLYPHYLLEWIEWLGFWVAAGWSCTPARAFLVNEMTAMLPRAVNGKKWYVDKFGPEKINKKWAVIPGVW